MPEKILEVVLEADDSGDIQPIFRLKVFVRVAPAKKAAHAVDDPVTAVGEAVTPAWIPVPAFEPGVVVGDNIRDLIEPPAIHPLKSWNIFRIILVEEKNEMVRHGIHSSLISIILIGISS